MRNVFEGTPVKRYALRYRPEYYKPWEYPPELQYDTVEEARAALDALTDPGTYTIEEARATLNDLKTPGTYQIVEKYPCVRWQPVTVQEAARSTLLENLLADMGRKPYKLQRSSGHGWTDCEGRFFDSLKEAQAAAFDSTYSGTGGAYRVLGAVLDFRYEPVEGV